jgi:hypothetical protein
MSTTEPDYAAPDVAATHDEPGPNRALLPLLVVFVGLALATVWLVVLPALHTPKAKSPARPCASFIVSKSGSARCVDAPVSAAQDSGAQPPAAYP